MMKKSVKIVCVLFAAILCCMFVLSIADTNETRKSTNFNQENMLTHIEKLSENGPRSIVDREANEKALQYIVAQIESYREVLRDYDQLIPAAYAGDSEKLHFNLWLTAEFRLGQ